MSRAIVAVEELCACGYVPIVGARACGKELLALAARIGVAACRDIVGTGCCGM